MPAEGAPKAADTLDVWVKSAGRFTAAADTKPSSLRARLRLAVGASDASQNNA